jgi:outer membrane biosynthesis protein TonB
MSKSAVRKLKVFQAQIGFYDTVVATTSMPAALRAWGIRQNMFASGDARAVTDEVVIAVALQHPDIPLRRAVGSSEPFSVEPTSLPKVPLPAKTPPPKRIEPVVKPPPTKTPPQKRSEPVAKPRAAKPPARPVANRAQLDAATAAVRELDLRYNRKLADSRREEVALAARRAAAKEAYVEAREQASATVVSARDAYVKAGGTV